MDHLKCMVRKEIKIVVQIRTECTDLFFYFCVRNYHTKGTLICMKTLLKNRLKETGEVNMNTKKQGLWTIVTAVACTIIFFMLSEVKAKADGVEVNTWEGLQSEVSSTQVGASKTITLTADITPANPTTDGAYILISGEKRIFLDLNGHIINRNLETAVSNGSVIKLTYAASLTINDSNSDSDHSNYPASMGAISFNGGGIIGGNTRTMGGGIHLSNATLTMNGGTIYSCSAEGGGGGVYLVSGSDFIMNGGTIASCTSTVGAGKGGGVYGGDSQSTFTMNGGTITSCTGNIGGGVYSTALFTMKGGTITSCSANANGGGVYQRRIEFTMETGEIRACMASKGGGVYVDDVGGFIMNGGIISGCAATENGGGIYNNGDSATVDLSGGTISSCSAPICPDIYTTDPTKVTVRSRVLVRNDLINSGIIFDGTDKKLIDGNVVSVTGSALSLKFAVTETNNRPGSGNFTTSFPDKREAGTYYVWYEIYNSNNRETIEGGPLFVSIGQATPCLATTPAGVTGLTANNTLQALITGGTAQAIGAYTPEVKYAVTRTNSRPASGYASDIPSETAAGTYYVWYMIEGTRNWSAVNTFDPITVVIGEPATDPDPANAIPGPASTPVIVTPVYDPEPMEEKSETPKSSIFTRKNKDGSVTTITIIWNEDGTTTVITETMWADGSVVRKEETRDSVGNGTVKTEKKDGKDNILSSTEGTIKVNKKGTETIKSTTENSDGSGSEKTQKTYKRDPEAGNIKKVTTTEKKTDAAGNTEVIKSTALVSVLGEATITEKSTCTSIGKDGKTVVNVKEERQYSLSVNGIVKLLSLTSDGEKIIVSENIESDGITRVIKSIGKNAIKDNNNVKEVLIGDNITTICAGAFKNCKNLELIELTSSVKKIYKNAFKGIAKNAKFVIEASEEDFVRIVELLKKSGVAGTVTFERV